MPIDCPSREAKPIDLVEGANGQANLPNDPRYALIEARPHTKPRVWYNVGRAGLRPSRTPLPSLAACRPRRPPQTQTRRFPSYSSREGGVKADKADIFPERPHPDRGISSSCQLQVRPTCQRDGSCHQRPNTSEAPHLSQTSLRVHTISCAHASYVPTHQPVGAPFMTNTSQEGGPTRRILLTQFKESEDCATSLKNWTRA